jgi:hypothetical protein
MQPDYSQSQTNNLLHVFFLYEKDKKKRSTSGGY